MKLDDLLHHRILIAEKTNSFSSESKVVEIKILEISPSKEWVKIQNMNGNKFWKHYSDINPIEVLKRIER